MRCLAFGAFSTSKGAGQCPQGTSRIGSSTCTARRRARPSAPSSTGAVAAAALPPSLRRAPPKARALVIERCGDGARRLERRVHRLKRPTEHAWSAIPAQHIGISILITQHHHPLIITQHPHPLIITQHHHPASSPSIITQHHHPPSPTHPRITHPHQPTLSPTHPHQPPLSSPTLTNPPSHHPHPHHFTLGALR